MNARVKKIPVDQIVDNPDIKPCDNELIELIAKTFDWQFNNELAQFPVQHGISYLDSLCSVRFDKLGRSDKRKIVEIMQMVLKKTNELMDEATNGLESEEM